MIPVLLTYEPCLVELFLRGVLLDLGSWNHGQDKGRPICGRHAEGIQVG
jgi:hypothetical protein